MKDAAPPGTEQSDATTPPGHPAGAAPPARAAGSAGPGKRLLVALFPLVLLLLVAAGTVANVNGSSVSLNVPDWRTDTNLIAGEPRAIRSDEWYLYTPNTIGNARRGYPNEPFIGLTPSYIPATGLNVVSAHWTEAFRPLDVGFPLLGPSRGFSLRWWAMLATGLVGVYALLYSLTRRIVLSAGLAVVAVCTPFVAWWSITPGYVLGSLCLGTACAIAGLRARRRWTPPLWGAAGAYLFVGPGLILYPPWPITVGLICAAVVAGVLLDERPGWRRALASVGTGLLTLGVVLGLWYLQAGDAIRAQADTYYPGHRITESGKGNMRWLLDAPSSLWLSHEKPLGLSRRMFAADFERAGGGRTTHSWWKRPAPEAALPDPPR